MNITAILYAVLVFLVVILLLVTILLVAKRYLVSSGNVIFPQEDHLSPNDALYIQYLYH